MPGRRLRGALPATVGAPFKRAAFRPIPRESVRALTSHLLVATVLAAAGCGGGGAHTPTAVTPAPPDDGLASALVFTASPIDPGVIEFIVPLGNLNPPDHTLPTDHIYFYHRLRHPAAPVYDVVAPAGGIVREARRGNDDTLRVQVTATHTYYLGHVRLDAAIHDGMALAAGQRIGTTSTLSYGLDVGLEDLGVTRFFANPARYGEGTIHAESALRFFQEPLRSTLYGLVERLGAEKDGKIDFDQPGRLAGNWFLEGLAPAESSIFGNGRKHLAFVRDVRDPSIIRVSLGGALGVTGVFAVQQGAPDPADVAPASGVVLYRLTIAPGSQQVATLLVEMADDRRLRAEAFPPSATPTGFTAGALTYLR